MPIHQPAQAIIHTSDFQNKSYCFDVESILSAQERIGMLTVSTSAGYLLATSSNSEFKREQTLEHVLQDNGSWVAKGSVTLIIAADSPTEGIVSIRNSSAEKVILTIGAASPTSTALSHPPGLTVNQSMLAFSPTSVDRPGFAVLLIAQQHCEVPVTLTTDAPEYFQLASDSRPVFSPALTLMPSASGTYVHVRYSASKAGFHAGQLMIQNSFEKITVALEARSSGFLPIIRTRPIVIRKPSPLRIPNQLSGAKRWVGVLSFLTISSLLYAGYTNRCQLFPALCQATTSETSQVKMQVQAVRSLPVLTQHSNASDKIAVRSAAPEQVERKETAPPVNELSPSPRESSADLSERQITADDETDQDRRAEAEVPVVSGQQKLKQQDTYSQPPRQAAGRVSPAVSTDESELERTLNQKPDLLP